MEPAIRVIHDAGGLVVVDKPPGLETSGRTIDDPGGVQHRLARALGRPVWAVHQLDRDTSGVLVFVRRRALVAEWQRAIKPPHGRKLYLAIVHGVPAWETQRIELALRYDDGARRWAIADDGKPALSVARRLAIASASSLVEVELVTGRTHQARVHLAHLGHPLVGERRYREPPCELHPRHALHALRLELSDGRAFAAPMPADLQELADRLGLALP